ncbi:hypothetical protein CR513_23480, partial [Mucuna pruriens]
MATKFYLGNKSKPSQTKTGIRGSTRWRREETEAETIVNRHWKEICGIRQHSGETLHEYWERFNKLCATCPHHQISEQLLIQYFYEGLTMMDRSMIDAVSGGALMDKTPAAARHLITNMASNTQ